MGNRGKTSERQINLELLRIVSMFLIILLHSIDHSGVLQRAENLGGKIYYIELFLYALTQVSVNLFVMISGYFLVKSDFKMVKIIRLWLEVVFYSLTIRIIFIVVGIKAFSTLSVISCFFPVVTGRYWFVTIYLGMYVISPFLNITIKALSKRQLASLNITLFLLFSAWNTIVPEIKGMNAGAGWGLPWFIVLYFSAAWFRLYHVRSMKWTRNVVLWIMIGALTALSVTFSNSGSIAQKVFMNWYRYDSVPVYLATILLFSAFLNMEIRALTVQYHILWIAQTTFGVYLIHAHADISPWLWGNLQLPEKMNTLVFPIFQIGIVLTIFVISSMIDLLRRMTIGKIEEVEAINLIARMIDSARLCILASVSK